MKNNPPIALLTDFGTTDVYAGLLKAVIASISPQANVIDLSHGVQPQNILQGAVMLADSYSYFPQGTVFVCVVDPGVGTSRKILAVKTARYILVGPDNGLLTLALEKEKSAEIRSLENAKFFRDERASSTFHGRDIMAPAAAHLLRAKGKVFAQMGPLIAKAQSLRMPKIQKSREEIKGSILYFDSYGNAITNIRREDAAESFWNRASGWIKKKNLGRIRRNYEEGKGRPLFLWNSFSRLEIAWPRGSAQKRMNLKAGDSVVLKGNA